MGDNNTQPNAQTGQSSKANGVAGEVGVPHSSVDLHYFKRCKEPRGDTYSMRGGEAKDAGMAGAIRIVTPNKVRELQIALYRKAKSCPMNEFGEPNMGNPPVRFDEGRESVGHWPLAFQSSLSRLLYDPALRTTGAAMDRQTGSLLTLNSQPSTLNFSWQPELRRS